MFIFKRLRNVIKPKFGSARYYSARIEDPCSSVLPYTSWDETKGGVSCTGETGSGLILGLYTHDQDQQAICLTKAAALFNHNNNGQLVRRLKEYGPLPKVGELRSYTKLDPSFGLVTVVGLGNNDTGYVKQEARDEAKENIRKGVGVACQFLQENLTPKIYVEGFDDPESAAEGAALALWTNQSLVENDRRKFIIPDITLYGDCNWKKWSIGLVKAEAQNFARSMMECPANLMFPRAFGETVVQSLCKSNVNVQLRGGNWLRENNMNAFISNTKGSAHMPFLLELDYIGCDPAVPPIVLIGKGMTFNSGGLCLKDCEEIKHMRGDMAGAAVAVATLKAVAELGLPINVRGLIPLGENMPGGTAARPGDIVKSTSGKTVLVTRQDFDGNLMMIDTLCYAQKLNPKYIISLTTMHDEIKTSFDLSCAGAFTNNEKLWQLLKTASVHSGDRLWKLPLWQVYEREIKDSFRSDVSNYVKYPRGIPCTNSAFLHQFLCKPNWAHIDLKGTMYEDGTTPYLRSGMSGRPTRMLIEFLGQIAYPPQHGNQ